MTVQQSKQVAYVITLCNKNSCADVHHYITIRIQAHRDASIQVRSTYFAENKLYRRRASFRKSKDNLGHTRTKIDFWLPPRCK